MENILVCYDWRLAIHVENRNGRNYKNHIMSAYASCFDTAKSVIKEQLKKKKWKFFKISKVVSVKVASAVYTEPKSGDIPKHLYPELPMPEIPKDLNKKKDTTGMLFTVTDLYGKEILVTNLEKAIAQADEFRHYVHTDPLLRFHDKKLKAYWNDLYQKLIKIKQEAEG